MQITLMWTVYKIRIIKKLNLEFQWISHDAWAVKKHTFLEDTIFTKAHVQMDGEDCFLQESWEMSPELHRPPRRSQVKCFPQQRMGWGLQAWVNPLRGVNPNIKSQFSRFEGGHRANNPAQQDTIVSKRQLCEAMTRKGAEEPQKKKQKRL